MRTICIVVSSLALFAAGCGEPERVSHGEAASLLANAGFEIVSPGNCPDKENAYCTSLDGVRRTTLEGVINLKEMCGCGTLTVTGGTEAGHANEEELSHTNGYKLDVAAYRGDGPKFSTFLSGLAQTASGVVLQPGRSASFWRDSFRYNISHQGDHWDILVDGA